MLDLPNQPREQTRRRNRKTPLQSRFLCGLYHREFKILQQVSLLSKHIQRNRQRTQIHRSRGKKLRGQHGLF